MSKKKSRVIIHIICCFSEIGKIFSSVPAIRDIVSKFLTVVALDVLVVFTSRCKSFPIASSSTSEVLELHLILSGSLLGPHPLPLPRPRTLLCEPRSFRVSFDSNACSKTMERVAHELGEISKAPLLRSPLNSWTPQLPSRRARSLM